MEKNRHSEPILVSACLIGLGCRYNGEPLPQDVIRSVKGYLTGKIFIPVCPEQLGGLPTPRPPMEIVDGDGNDVLEGKTLVLNSQGEDVTQHLLKGASFTAEIASLLGAKLAIFKEGSPSCGVRRICRRGTKVKGVGVASAFVARQGIRVLSEEDLG